MGMSGHKSTRETLGAFCVMLSYVLRSHLFCRLLFSSSDERDEWRSGAEKKWAVRFLNTKSNDDQKIAFQPLRDESHNMLSPINRPARVTPKASVMLF